MDDPLSGIEARQLLTNMADLLGHYHRELMAQGFSRHEGLMVVIAWQAAVASNSKPQDETA